MAENTNLATQVINLYKGGGRYVFFADVKPRAFKEGKDAALGYGKTSLCSLNLFDSESKVGVVCYLEPGDPAYMLAKIKSKMSTPAPALIGNPEIYTLKGKFGDIKDLTPAEFCLKNGKDEQTRVYKALKSATGTYAEANKKWADLIFEAGKLKSEGKLQLPETVRESLLYELKTPDNTKLDSKGNTECRELTIWYEGGAAEPYKIQIRNFWAPPAGGQVGAIVSKYDKETEKKLMMSFSEKDFFTVWDELYKGKMLYADSSSARRIRYADEHSWHPGQ